MTAQEEFRVRIERDVARIMRHLVGSEMNPVELDGEIVLSIRNGELFKVEFADDTRGVPFARQRKGKGKTEPTVETESEDESPAEG